jgi:hypothetical protein
MNVSLRCVQQREHSVQQEGSCDGVGSFIRLESHSARFCFQQQVTPEENTLCLSLNPLLLSSPEAEWNTDVALKSGSKAALS